MSGRLLIRGGCVLTLGPKSSNHPEADVLVEDGRVAEIGPKLRARDAEVIDASAAIVMPGFVDTHRHAWTSLFRNAGDDIRLADLGPHHGPDDVYAATLVGLLSALEAGITTVVDWADVPPDRLEAVAQAHTDAGIRTVLVQAAPEWTADTDPLAVAPDVEHRAFGGPDPRRDDVAGSTGGWAEARRAGLRIHVHVGRRPGDAGVVSALAEARLLGEDVTLVHCSLLEDADLDAVASSGARVSISPSAEMAGGLGSPPMQRFIDRGIRPGLGVDDERFGPGDLFAQMRAAISIQHGHHFDLKLAGKGGLPNLMTTREVIRFATYDGAVTAGLGSVTGSLEVGKQADIVVLRTDRPNIHPVNDPIGAVVWGMDTSNVDTVLVGGTPVLRDGTLQRDLTAVRTAALEAHRRVAAESGLLGVGGS